MQDIPVCIYQDQNIEGFVCAWSIWKKLYTRCEFIALTNDDDVPNVKNRDVYILNVLYNIEKMKKIINESNNVILIDNKQSSEALLTFSNKITGIVNTDVSLCILVWNYFHITKHPTFFEYLQDKKFWKFELPYFKEVNTAISNYDLIFENYDLIESIFIDDLIIEGTALLRKFDNDIKNILKYKKFIIIDDMTIPIVQTPYFYAFECANVLAEEYGVGISYHCVHNNIIFSLRSKKSGNCDVSKIAEIYGGGGPEHDAGFVISIDVDPIQKILDKRKIQPPPIDFSNIC